MNPKHFEHDKNLMAWDPKAGPAVKSLKSSSLPQANP